MARTSKTAAPSDQVVIACKLPQGLHIVVPGTTINLKLHGSASPYAVADHGITRGIRTDVWEKIKEHFADARWLKNEIVFEMRTPESAAAKAEERADVQVGFEPIDPAKPGNVRGAGSIQVEGQADPYAQ